MLIDRGRMRETDPERFAAPGWTATDIADRRGE